MRTWLLAFVGVLSTWSLADADTRPELIKYEKEIIRAADLFGHAYAVSICRLRSNQWFESFRLGYYYFVSNEQKSLGITPDEAATIEKKTLSVFQGAAQVKLVGDDNTCDKLANSALMRQLDQIESQIIGGYH